MCRCPHLFPIRCQHAPGGFGGVRPRPRSVLAAGGPCPCVVGCQKNARVCLGSAGCAPARGIWGGQTGQLHHTHRKHWGGWWGARPCPWHRAGPTSVGPQGPSRRPKAREKQRLEGKRPGARSPPCGGRSRPPFQAHTAHHAPNLNAKNTDTLEGQSNNTMPWGTTCRTPAVEEWWPSPAHRHHFLDAADDAGESGTG